VAILTAVTGLPGAGVQQAGTSISPTPRPPSSVAPTAAQAADCNGGFGAVLTVADIPELLYLPPASVAGDALVSPVLAREQRANCLPAPIAAIWYSATDGTVTARMQVDGPGVADPNTAPGSGFGGTVTQERLGDRQVDVYHPADGADWITFSWTEPDGGTWSATVQGLDPASARAAVRGLSVSSSGVGPDSRPEALPESVTLSGATPRTITRYFYAAFGNLNQDQGGWTVEVHQADYDGWQAMVGAHAVDVDGSPGWSSTGKGVGIRWTAPDGVVLAVNGSIDQEKALRVARSLVKVSPDDPRLVAARETPDPSSTETAPPPTASATG
jgi:hypothetical protein